MAGKIKLTAKQRRFVEEYCVDFNATQAAIRAEYSEKTARQTGSENLAKPVISEAIEERLNSLDLNAAQVSKLMADIAQSSMNDYFKVVERQRMKYVDRPLQVLIDKKLLDIRRNEMYAERKGWTDELWDKFQEGQQLIYDEILKLEIDLELDPDAKFTDSEYENYETVELDLVKLTQDKERGKIKSFEMKETGPKVEMFAADKMITNIANKLGFFTHRVQNLDKNGEPTDPSTPDPLAPVNLTINVIERKVDADIQRTTEEDIIQP